jgi:hypothetical protein
MSRLVSGRGVIAAKRSRNSSTSNSSSRVPSCQAVFSSNATRPSLLEGFDLHSNVWVSANDRAGLERLCRYILRPPFAQERLRLVGKVEWHYFGTGGSWKRHERPGSARREMVAPTGHEGFRLAVPIRGSARVA